MSLTKCKECGTEFVRSVHNNVICSDECRAERNRVSCSKRYKKNRAAYIARATRRYEEKTEEIRDYKRRWHQENKDAVAIRVKDWQQANPEKAAFNFQKASANKRGIEFCFSFDEWVEWWGDDFSERGAYAEGLCMCRYNDDGPYSAENCYKATIAENSAGPRRADEVVRQ